MSELFKLAGEGLMRSMSKLEDATPGLLLSVPEIETIIGNLDINLPDDDSVIGLVDQLLNWGWIETNNNGFELSEQSFGISAKGLLRAASSVDYRDEFSRAFDSLPMLDDQPVEFKSESTPVIDSSRWTGLPKRGVLNAEATSRLKNALASVDDAVDSFEATNEERAQARAYLIALNAFADAPEPPADLIWEIISRANQLSGIASIFVSLLALFAAVAN